MRCLLLALLVMLSLPAAATSPQPGFADPVLGRWNLSVRGADGASYPSWFDIRLRTEAELMATMVGRFGSARHASHVEFKDGKLLLRVARQYEKAGPELVFEGGIAGQRLAGTTRGEQGEALDWTAERAPVLAPTVKPRWGKPVQLFNGRDLQGWAQQQGAHGPCWKVTGGVLENAASCANLVSESRFGDFTLHMEFMNTPGGNSGLYLRGRYEVQLSDAAGQASDPLRMGAIYGHLRPRENATRKAGQWQTLDVTLNGRVVTIVLNGTTLIDAQEIPGITGGALDSAEAEPGPLMLQGDHTAVRIRKLELRARLP